MTDMKVGTAPPAGPPITLPPGPQAAPRRAGRDGGVTTGSVPPPAPPSGSKSAPKLAPANTDAFSLDTIQMWAANMNTDLSNEQGRSSVNEIKSLNEQKEAMTRKVQDLIDQANKAAKDAQDAAGTNKIIGWVVTIGAAVGAVGITLATGGAALPVALTAVMGALSVTSMALQQAGVQVQGPDGQMQSLDLSIPGAVNAAIDGMVESGAIVETHVVDGKEVDQHGNEINEAYKAAHPGALVVDSSTLSAAKLATGIVLSIVIEGGIGKIAANSAIKAAKAAESAKDLEKVSEKASKLEGTGQKLAIGGGVTQGGGTVASGGVSLKGAEANLSKDQSNTEKNYTQGEQQVVEKKSKRQIDMWSKLSGNSTDALRQISKNIAAKSELDERIAKVNV